MGKIEINVVLLSFVWVLALTQILECCRDLWVGRGRVKWAASPLLWMLAVLLTSILSWLPLADFGDAVRGWLLVGLLAYSLGIFFAAAVVSPKVPEAGVLDLAEYETREGAAFKLTLIALMMLALPLDFALGAARGQHADVARFLAGEWSVFATMIAYLIGLSPNPWLRTPAATAAVALGALGLVRNVFFA